MSRDRDRPKTGKYTRIRIIVLSLLLIGLSAYVLLLYVQGRNQENNTFDRVRALLERSVFLGPMLDNEPDAKIRLRETILSSPGMADDENARRAAVVAIGLNLQYVAPALRAADDANILSVWLTRTETALSLSDKNAEACAVFVRNSSVWPAELGKDFKEVYQRHLDAQKTAYLDGYGKQPRAVLDEATFSTLLLGYLGFSDAEIAVLEEPSSKSAEDICAVGITIATGLGKIPEQHQIPFVRHYLTVQNPL